MDLVTDSVKKLSLTDKEAPKKLICNDLLPADTKYWLCSCASYPGQHSHTRSRSEPFDSSRVTKDNIDKEI